MLRNLFAAMALSAFLLGVPAHAAQPKTYQVTGPVLELTSDMIVIKKGSDRWEIARDASTKVTGDLKVGATVTIQYRMTAASVDVKAEKAKKK
jgi:RNase P/RNase MRP subunit p29